MNRTFTVLRHTILVFLVLFTGSCRSNNDSRQEALNVRLGLTGTAEDQAAAQLSYARRREDLVVLCMRQRGFKYVPYPLVAIGRSIDPGRYDDRKWMLQHGYGQADSLTATSSVTVNPNDEIFKKLSKGERDKYNLALVGPPIQSGNPFRGAGCIGDAYNKENDKALLFASKLSELNTRIQADPRSIELNRVWSRCMVTYGFRVSAPTTINAQLLNQERLKVYGKLARFLPASGPDVIATVNGLDPTRIARFRVHEMQVAKADLKCMTADMEKRATAIRKNFTKQFLKDNQLFLASFTE